MPPPTTGGTLFDRINAESAQADEGDIVAHSEYAFYIDTRFQSAPPHWDNPIQFCRAQACPDGIGAAPEQGQLSQEDHQGEEPPPLHVLWIRRPARVARPEHPDERRRRFIAQAIRVQRYRSNRNLMCRVLGKLRRMGNS